MQPKINGWYIDHISSYFFKEIGIKICKNDTHQSMWLPQSNMLDNGRYHITITSWIIFHTFENKCIENTMYVILPLFQPLCKIPLHSSKRTRSIESKQESLWNNLDHNPMFSRLNTLFYVSFKLLYVPRHVSSPSIISSK